MFLLRFIFLLFLLCLILMTMALGYLHFLDINQYNDRIVSRLGKAMGREVTIGNLDVDLWPDVTLTADRITLANADWGSQPHMARLGHLSVTLGPASLLFGRPLVKDFILEDVELLVESDAQDKSNWELAQPAPEPGKDPDLDTRIEALEEAHREVHSEAQRESAGGGMPITLQRVLVTNVLLTRRGQLTEEQQLRLDRLALQPIAGSRLGLIGSGEMLALPLTLKGQFSDRVKLGEVDTGSFTLEGSLGTLGFEVSGQPADQGAPGDMAMETLLMTDDVAVFLESVGMSLPLLGALRVQADFIPLEAGQTLAVDAVLGDFTTQLTLGFLASRITVDGKLQGLDTLGAMLGAQDLTTAEVAFNGSAEVSTSAGDLSIHPLQLNVGSSDVAGKIRLVSGETRMIQVDLKSGKLDLNEVMEPIGGRQEPAGEAAEPPTVASQKEFIFGEQPLPFRQLQSTEMDFSLNVGQFLGRASVLQELSILGSLHGGELKVAVDYATPVGARSASTLQLSTSGQHAQLQATVNTQDMRLNIASGKDAQPQDIPPVSVSMNISSSGDSPRALAASSSGNLLVTFGRGQIDNKLMRSITGDVFDQLMAALNPFAEKDPHTVFECGVIAFTIEDGLSTLDPMVMQGEKVTILARGELDLKTEEIRFKFNTQPRKGIGLSADMFVTPFVALDGTLARPKVGVNKTGTLLTAATGGLSLVLQAINDRNAGTVDHCIETLPGYNHPPL